MEKMLKTQREKFCEDELLLKYTTYYGSKKATAERFL